MGFFPDCEISHTHKREYLFYSISQYSVAKADEKTLIFLTRPITIMQVKSTNEVIHVRSVTHGRI